MPSSEERRMKSAESAAAPSADVDLVDKERWFGDVEDALKEVFGTAADKYRSRLDRLRDYMMSAPTEVWHIDPFQVAADLADVKEVRESHMRRFRDLRRRGDPGGEFPDDEAIREGVSRAAGLRNLS